MFSNSLSVEPSNENFVLESIEMLNNKSLFSPINLDYVKFIDALKKKTNNSHVCGYDGVSAYMLKHTSNYFKNTIIFSFFSFMFNYCVIPDELNYAFIRPILKDNKKSNSD